MAHQYVSLTEAAAILKLSESEVNALREQGDLRGFADRGAWKFRKDAVEDYARFRSTGSDPDVPAVSESGSDATDLFRTHDLSDSKPDVLDHMGDEDSDVDGAGSSDRPLLADDADDSSGFLLGDESPRAGTEKGDSGRFKLGDIESGIFSEGADDSGINLVPEDDGVTVGGADSGIAIDLDDESGVLVPGSTPDGSAPNDFDETDGVFDKTVTFEDEAPKDEALDRTAVFDDESGLALDLGGETSDVTLDDGEESGIALDLAEDSGITLDDAGDSGIALDFGDDSGLNAGDSGIALDAGDSGLALDFATESDVVAPSGVGRAAAVPGADVDEETLDFVPDEVSADSEFDLGASEQSLEFDAGSESLGGLADGDEFDDEIGDDPDDELDGELDEFDDEFDEFDESGPAGDQFEDDVERPRGGRRTRQTNWGTATFAGLVLCSLVMGVTGLVTWQSMRQMWNGRAQESVLDPVVDAVTGLIP